MSRYTFTSIDGAHVVAIEASTWFEARTRAAASIGCDVVDLRPPGRHELELVADVLTAAGRRTVAPLAADVRQLVVDEAALRGAAGLAADLLAGAGIAPRTLKSGAAVTGAIDEARALEVLARLRAALGGRS